MIKRTFIARMRKILLRRSRALLRRAGAGGDLLRGLSESEKLELAEIHSALERVERGIFGRCVDCNSAMEESFIEETPWRTSCEACAESAVPGVPHSRDNVYARV